MTTLETKLFVIIVITGNKQNLFQHFILFYSLVKKELILSDDHIKPATQVMKISFLLCGLFHRALSARKLHINLQRIYCSMWTRPQDRKLIFYQTVEVYLAASVAAIFFLMGFHVSPTFSTFTSSWLFRVVLWFVVCVLLVLKVRCEKGILVFSCKRM